MHALFGFNVVVVGEAEATVRVAFAFEDVCLAVLEGTFLNVGKHFHTIVLRLVFLLYAVYFLHVFDAWG